MLDLDQLLRHAVERRASDLHLKVGARPFLRVDGALQETEHEVIEPADTERIAFAIMPPTRAEEFRERHETDFVHGIAGLGRFRVSAFRQRGWVGLVLRRVLPGTPGFDALALPGGVATLAESGGGLVLVTGLAGSGKTSTLAAMVDHVNQRAPRHIITIEDPIEVLHVDKRSIVDQREVGTDTPDVSSAIARALRQDPDVIVIGEVRDADAARAALEAADTGYLVLGTMPAVSVIDALTRLVELFPPYQRETVRSLLARALRGVVCQRLVPRAGGRGRVPAVEVLAVNSQVRERLAERDGTAALEEVMRDGDFYGMQTFDESLLRLHDKGLVEREVALAHASYAPGLRVELERSERERARAPIAQPPGPVVPPAPQPGQTPVGVAGPSERTASG